MKTEIRTENSISYESGGDSLLVVIPFEIKDLFKKAFKTAKWDSMRKKWSITNNTRNINKLEKWIVEVIDVCEKIEEAKLLEDAIELEGTVLDDLRNLIKEYENKIISKSAQIEKIEKLKKEQLEINKVLDEAS